MLIEFNFRNFKSYRERASLQLTAGRCRKHPFHITELGGEKFLPCAVIFGANASGKSNVYEAFVYMRGYVLNSFSYGGGDSEQAALRPPRLPFRFNEEARALPTEFEVFFIDDSDPKSRTWQYGFALDDDRVVEEWLCCKSKSASKFAPVFLRKFDEKRKSDVVDWYGGQREEVKNSIQFALAPETLIVSLGSKMQIPEFRNVTKWFAGARTISFSAPVENWFRSTMIPSGFDQDESVQRDLAKYLATFDSSIQGFNVEKTSSPDDPSKVSLKIDSKHRTSSGDGYALLPFAHESGGTQKMFSLYADIRGALENGGVLFIDELSARLHPLLHLNILLSFLRPETNRKRAQLIVTTHDAALLEFDYLRSDEMWLAEKDSNEESTLFSFVEFKDIKKLRGKQNRLLMKNYLVGKLGGVPSLSPIDFGDLQ